MRPGRILDRTYLVPYSAGVPECRFLSHGGQWNSGKESDKEIYIDDLVQGCGSN